MVLFKCIGTISSEIDYMILLAAILNKEEFEVEIKEVESICFF